MGRWLKGLFLYGNVNKLIGQMVLLSIPVIILGLALWASYLWVRVLVIIILGLLGLVLFVRFLRWVLRSLGIIGGRFRRPPFRLKWLLICFSVILVAFIVCIFAGVEPISTYMDKARFGITCEDMQVIRGGNLVVLLSPTRVTAGMYMVTLYENGSARQTQKVSWSSPEANLKVSLPVEFKLSPEEASWYWSAYSRDKESWWKPFFNVRVAKLEAE